MPRYRISHETTYRYGATVAQSQHQLHVSPRDVAHQRIIRHTLTVAPTPTWRSERIDYFGNPTTFCAIEKDHRQLSIVSASEIEVGERRAPQQGASAPWEAVSAGTVAGVTAAVREFTSASNHIRPSQMLHDFAAPSFPAGRGVLDGAADFMRRIKREFRFDNTTTDIATPVERVIKQKSGVCQDFAHVMIAGLRSMGLPARYVSGYILTHPPPGKEKLYGTDASHAWVEVWAPEIGWVDFDPTNALINSTDLITVAYGRDFDDVSPIRGVLLGGGDHSVLVAVDVRHEEGKG